MKRSVTAAFSFSIGVNDELCLVGPKTYQVTGPVSGHQGRRHHRAKGRRQVGNCTRQEHENYGRPEGWIQGDHRVRDVGHHNYCEARGRDSGEGCQHYDKEKIRISLFPSAAIPHRSQGRYLHIRSKILRMPAPSASDGWGNACRLEGPAADSSRKLQGSEQFQSLH